MTTRISGVLIDGFGKPIANAQMQAVALETGGSIVGSSAHTRTGGDGSYDFTLEIGSYSFSIWMGSLGYQYVGNIRVYENTPDCALDDILSLPSSVQPVVLTKVLQAVVDAQEAADNAAGDVRENLIPLGKQYMTLSEAQSDIANIPTGSTTYYRSPDDSALAIEVINNAGTLQPTGRKMPSQKSLDILREENTNLVEIPVSKMSKIPNLSACIDPVTGKVVMKYYNGWFSFQLDLTGEEKFIVGTMSAYVGTTNSDKVPYFVVVDRDGNVLNYNQPSSSGKAELKISNLPPKATSVYLNYRIFGSVDTADSYGILRVYNYAQSLLSTVKRVEGILASNGLDGKTDNKTLYLKDVCLDPNILIGSRGDYAQSKIFRGWRMARIDLLNVQKLTGSTFSYRSPGEGLYIPALVIYDIDGNVLQYLEARDLPDTADGDRTINIDLTLPPESSYAIVITNYLKAGTLVLHYVSGSMPLAENVGRINTLLTDNGILPLDRVYTALTGRADNPLVLVGSGGSYARTGVTYAEWYNIQVDLSDATSLKGAAYSFNRDGVMLPAIVIYSETDEVLYYLDNTTTGGKVTAFDVEVTPGMSYAIIQYRNTIADLYFDVMYDKSMKKGLGERISALEEGESFPNFDLMFPVTVYNVANDIGYKTAGQTHTGPRLALKRNFSATLYLDNFIQSATSEPGRMSFKNGGIRKIVPAYSPVITSGAIENPNLNGGQNVYEEAVTCAIVGNTENEQTRVIKNRSVLNSASKDKTPTILIIGDSVSFGQDAYFPDSNAKWNYTMILNHLFAGDKQQNGGSGYGFRTVGTISFTDAEGRKSYNESYSGTTLQGSGLFTNPKFLDGNGAFSFSNWLQKYRTCNANGARLYFDANKSTTGTAGANNKGYLEDGSDSGLMIGSSISNTLSIDVYEPTHVFCFHCSNGAISKADYDLFISRVRATFPAAVIGLGTPHVAGTYFPSHYPDVYRPAIWDYDQTYNNRQVSTARVLLANYCDEAAESNKVFVLPTMWVTPAADAFSCITINDPWTDIKGGGNDKLMPVGQRVDVHVGSKAQAAYAYQIYSWLKWTAAQGLF